MLKINALNHQNNKASLNLRIKNHQIKLQIKIKIAFALPMQF
jgi:hypothetical protein